MRLHRDLNARTPPRRQKPQGEWVDKEEGGGAFR